MHFDLQTAGRRRLVATAAAGIALLTCSIALLLFPFVAVSMFVLSPLFGDLSVAAQAWRSFAISVTVGFVTAASTTALAWHRAERDALRSADLQLAAVPGARIDVVPSWRVAGDALPRVRTLLDTLAIAAGVPAPRCAVVVDPAPNLLSIGRRPETAW